MNYTDVSFSPKIPIRIKKRNKILNKLSGSLKNKMPKITVPNAPIPVQTAYAVPIGRDLVANASK
jgi:hypothetical protein